ncbi:hypothetical protein BKI52_15170 [marine bacterium AO1-C]|nr:hypothetical protein BKI52_15170 [marine bacterium AO1-C]
MKTSLKPYIISALYLLFALFIDQSFAQKKRLMVQQGHSSFVETIAFSPDDSKIFTGSVDASFKIWDTKTGKLIQVVRLDNPTDYISGKAFFLKNGKQVLFRPLNNIQLWDLEKQERIWLNKNIPSDAELFNVSNKGDKILLVDKLNPLSKSIVLDINTQKKLIDVSFGLVADYKANEKGSVQMAKTQDAVFSPDGKALMSGLDNGEVIWLDIPEKRVFAQLTKDSVSIQKVGVSADGLSFFALNSNNLMNVWDVYNQKLLNSFQLPKEDTIIAFWPNQLSFVVSNANQLILKDLNTGQLIQKFILSDKKRYHYDPVISSNKATLLSLDNFMFMAWSVKTGKLLYKIESSITTSIPYRYSPDSTHITQVTLASKDYSLNKQKLIATKGKRQGDPNIYLKDAKTQELKATIYSGFSNEKAWIITTPKGKYDANEEGLQYLHYVKGRDKILPLPKRDRNRVKGLLKKILK